MFFQNEESLLYYFNDLVSRIRLHSVIILIFDMHNKFAKKLADALGEAKQFRDLDLPLGFYGLSKLAYCSF